LRSFLVHLREVGVEEPPSLIEGERSKYAIPGGDLLCAGVLDRLVTLLLMCGLR
jgi:hypothetical protein